MHQYRVGNDRLQSAKKVLVAVVGAKLNMSQMRLLSFHIRQISCCDTAGGHRQQTGEHSYSLLFDTGKAKLRILHPVLFPLCQGEDGEIGEEGCGGTRVRACT